MQKLQTYDKRLFIGQITVLMMEHNFNRFIIL